jgi:hypothetical protein
MGQTPVVHFVAVGAPYRRNGVARRLLAPALERPRVVYTQRTLLAKHLPIPAGWTYDPRRAIAPRLEESHGT